MNKATAFLVLSTIAIASAATDVTGKWTGDISNSPVFIIFKQDGAKLSGSGGPDENRQVLVFNSGTVEGDRLHFKAGPMQFDLQLIGEEIKGEVRNGDVVQTLTLKRAGSPQTRPQGPRAFETASVKVNKSGEGGITGRGGSIRNSPGQIQMENVSLWKCIGAAFGIGEDKDYAISGPPWLKTERYDIVAKIPPGASFDQVQVMMQTLLADRFKLAFHRETKELPIYALVVAKGGSKLQPVEFTRNSFSLGKGLVKATSAPLSAFADRLSQYLDRPVLDMTELKGVFDFTLEWTPDDGQAVPRPDSPERPASAPGPSIFTAIQQQLGLRLEGRKGPVPVLVIDHAEKVPTEN